MSAEPQAEPVSVLAGIRSMTQTKRRRGADVVITVFGGDRTDKDPGDVDLLIFLARDTNHADEPDILDTMPDVIATVRPGGHAFGLSIIVRGRCTRGAPVAELDQARITSDEVSRLHTSRALLAELYRRVLPHVDALLEADHGC